MAQTIQWSLDNHNHYHILFFERFPIQKRIFKCVTNCFPEATLSTPQKPRIKSQTKIESIFSHFCLKAGKVPIQNQCMFRLSNNWAEHKDLAVDELSFLRINNRRFSPTWKGKEQHILQIILVYIPLQFPSEDKCDNFQTFLLILAPVILENILWTFFSILAFGLSQSCGNWIIWYLIILRYINCLVECPTHQNKVLISEGNIREQAWGKKKRKKKERKLPWKTHLTISLIYPASLWEVFSQEQSQSMFLAF